MLLDQCPWCGCFSLANMARIVRFDRIHPIANPHQYCECDTHPDCQWMEAPETTVKYIKELYGID